MYIKEYYPDKFFGKYIDSYFTVDTSLITEDIIDLVVPDGTFGLLFIDSQDSIKRNIPTQVPPVTLRKSSFFGQKTTPVHYYYSHGNTKSFGIKINPEGLPLFLDDSSKEFKNKFLELDFVMDRGLKELEEKVHDKTAVEDKISVVEDYLLSKISKVNSNPDYLLFAAIVAYIKEKRGEVRFDTLTTYFNANYKKIERLFQHYLGVNPKTYIRIIRFNATIHLKSQLRDFNLTQLGNEVGFFDQSHFIREFKSFSNLTPKEFFSKEHSESEKVLMKMISNRWQE